MPRGTYLIDMDKVKMLALNKGWSMNMLSEKADVSYQVFIAYNKGHRSFPKTAVKIAKALGVKTSEIIVKE